MVDVTPVGSTTWNNMQLGTSDEGNLETFCQIVDSEFEYPKVARDKLAAWAKYELHPNVIKRDLLELFK